MKSQTHQIQLGACLAVVSLVLLLIQTATSPAPVSAGPAISNILITNVRDTTFTVSWLTDVASTGVINWGSTVSLGSTENDSRGAGTSATTHYVTVGSVNPSTTYYFDIISGTTTDNNNGNHFSLITGPTLALPPSDTAYGQVFKSDGTTLAIGTIVYLDIMDNNSSGSPGTSAPMSALVDSSGYWFYNLANARTADLGAYFSYSAAGGDSLRLSARATIDSNASALVDTGADKPVAPLYLAVPTAVTLSSFGVSIDSPINQVATISLILAGGILAAGFWRIRSR